MVVIFDCLRYSLHCLALPLLLKARCEIQDSALVVSDCVRAQEQGHTQPDLWVHIVAFSPFSNRTRPTCTSAV